MTGFWCRAGSAGALSSEDLIVPQPAPAYGDSIGGMTIAGGIMGALFHRERTGEGQLISATLLNTALAFQGSTVFDLPAADAMVHQRMERVHELQQQGAPYGQLVEAHNPMKALAVGNIYYRPYATKDGALAIGALSASLWAKVRQAIGTDFLGMADPAYNPLDPEWRAKAEAAVAEVEEKLRSKTTQEWMEIFDREGVPAGPVQFPEDLIDDPQVQANEMIASLEHELSGPQRQVGPIIQMAKTPLAAQGPSPVLGRHTDDYARLAGYSDDEIARLREQGILA